MILSRILTRCGLAFLIAGTISAQAAETVVRWGFGQEETTKLIAHGGVHRDVPGPRPPEFPDFDADNLAVKFDGSGAHYSFADSGPSSPMDFTNGDIITLEAWIKITELNKGENTYIVGKGRTGDKGFAKDNQNWALRIRETDGEAHVSFLFATPNAAKSGANKDAHWHRWTSIVGFTPGSGWHRVAVSYTFGTAKSIRGWIDAEPTDGTWDMGGETAEAPVVDDDAVWIASAQSGAASNSFRGFIDEISIQRGAVTDEAMKGRFRRMDSAREVAPLKKEIAAVELKIPEGRVLVTMHEGAKGHDVWAAPEAVPAETGRWVTERFLIPRLPLRYDDWGIRQSWKAPVLLRAIADIQLPPGKQKFILRARGMGRLWVDDTVIARTRTHSGSSDGYQPVPKVPEPPAPGLHIVGYGDQESFGEATVGADGKCRVVLEVMVGGKNLRAETGELSVAVQTPDGKSFTILQPLVAGAQPPSPMTDAVWEKATADAEASLKTLDDTARHTAAATQNEYWEKRHAAGRAFLASKPAAAPQLPAGTHPIDAFVDTKISRAVAAASGAKPEESKHFHGEVLPILIESCFRCHTDKEKGGLRLDSRDRSTRANDSGGAAVVPGKINASELIARVTSKDEGDRMPPTGDRLKPAQIALLEGWIKSGAPWPAPLVSTAEINQPPIVDDAAFLRRSYLDVVGVPPTEVESRAFFADASKDKRARLVDTLLNDPRYADGWMGYWQDVLAENPNILKPSLNNTGPFRWYLHEALRDSKPFDRMVTELILLRGSTTEGGSAGFGMAADNDAPFASKGQIVGSAFLGIELQCARCHDSPYHSTSQRDLYALSAMFSRKPVTVPKSSTVPVAFFEKKARESLIKVSLKPNEQIAATWPFEKACGVTDADIKSLVRTPDDSREKLAALITAPQNQRFAQVTVNRLWKRLIGAGIVEPAHDWEGHPPSHPELLDYLARDFVAHKFDLKHTIRLIMTSQLYQRDASGRNLKASPEKRFFAAPERRRLNAEQVVDSLYAAAGKRMETEEITFDPDSRRPASVLITLGRPSRAWMFASLSNERDRPSLSLPRAQAVIDVLEAFGWYGSRQNPRTDRETEPNVLQPGVLSNSLVSIWITRASADSGLAALAHESKSPEALVESVFLRMLARLPSTDERARFAAVLAPGFSDRLLPAAEIKTAEQLPRLSKVTWSSHLMPEATTVKLEMERRSRLGDPPDPRLNSAWRETYEDFVWSVINSPEFVWMP